MWNLIRYCHNEGIALLIAADTNSHSFLWGCREENPRGIVMGEIINSLNITVLNTGEVPTFRNRNGETIIDITAVNDIALPILNIEQWNVEDDSNSLYCRIYHLS